METTRRAFIGGLAALAPASSALAAQSSLTAYAFSFDRPGADPLALATFAGRPLLIVNTATECGYAPQFAGLQTLWTRFSPRGFAVIAVPSNDFGRQEPLEGLDIAEAARRQHGVTFPVVAKTEVRGPSAHPFYRWAAAERPGETPKWNFHKYLVGHDGRLAASFPTIVEPLDPRIIMAIGRELGE